MRIGKLEIKAGDIAFVVIMGPLLVFSFAAVAYFLINILLAGLIGGITGLDLWPAWDTAKNFFLTYLVVFTFLLLWFLYDNAKKEADLKESQRILDHFYKDGELEEHIETLDAIANADLQSMSKEEQRAALNDFIEKHGDFIKTQQDRLDKFKSSELG